MTWLRALVLVAAGATSACAFAVVGKEEFKAASHSREAAFPVGYQQLFRCFSEKVSLGSTGVLGMSRAAATAQLYPDLGLAEYRHSDREAFFSLIEFTTDGEARTVVRGFDVLADQLDANWDKVSACAADL